MIMTFPLTAFASDCGRSNPRTSEQKLPKKQTTFVLHGIFSAD